MVNLNEDLKLKILANEPIPLDDIFIYPISIKQIAKFGYKQYNQALKILCISRQEIKDLIGEDISPFEFLRVNMIFDLSIEKLLSKLLSLICKNKVLFSDEKQAFTIGNGLLNKNNFNTFVDIIREQNCIIAGNIDEKPCNEKAKLILEKRRKARNKLMKNSHAEENLSIYDLVNIVSVGMNLSINRVMEYSIYQLSSQFQRLMAKENYYVNILALIHGASKNNIDLKHWTQN